ncbi:MAG TPA: hypothetical protein PKL84_08090, partial [Candidatus Hydrogenedentes bacterium]|nr:hypothetical protein [Candidatus Hydrogenedentota bacterium]
MKRLLVLDALRGFFIIFVILFHALGHVMLWNGALIERQEIQTWTMVLFSPLILLGTWAPVFALISGAATAYVLHYLMAQGRGHALGAHVRGVYYNSAFLYVCSLIHMSMLHFRVVFNGAERFSFVTGSLEQGRLAKADVDLLFFTDAVALVAMAGVIVASVLWLLWRGDGFAHARRNYAVLVTLGLLWFLAAPWLHKALDTSFFAAVTDRDVPTALALKLIIGPPHSTFPNAGFSLFGAVLGIALARHEALAHLRRFGYGFGVFCMTVDGLILLYAGVPIDPERVGTALPVQLHFLNLG